MKRTISRSILLTVLILVAAGVMLFSGCDLSDSGINDPDPTLAKPQNVEAKVSGTDIVVTWDTVTGADSYVVSYFKDGDLAPTTATVTTNSFTHSKPGVGTRYYYKVKAKAGDLASTYSDQVSAIYAVYSITVDVPSSYFSSLSTTSAEIKINGNVVGTIYPADLESSGYTSFKYTFPSLLENLAVSTGSFSDLFDNLNDFAEYPEDITTMAQISKIVLYAKGNWSGDWIGTGADVGPKHPDFSIQSPTSNSFTVEFDPHEVVDGYTYNVYVSTEEYDDEEGWPVIHINSTTLVNTTPLNAGSTSTYTVNGLDPSTEYHVMVVATFKGISIASRYAKSATTKAVWTEGSLTAGEVKYYSFDATSGAAYTIYWDDSYEGSGFYTCDIKVGAYEEGENSSPLFDPEFVDSGYNYGESVTATKNGKIFVKVEGYNSDTGTYAIKVLDSQDQVVLLTEETDMN